MPNTHLGDTKDDYFYNEKRVVELDFLEKLCYRCGIGFKDVSGLCTKCKKDRD